MRRRCRARGASALLLVLGLLLAGCGGGAGAAGGDRSITLYTCISDGTIQPVIAAFEKGHPHTRVDLFRAPTGQLNARVAADARTGGLRADVVWACDPLTQQGWVDQGLVGGWTPPDATTLAGRYRTADYVGAALLYVVAVVHAGVPAPRAWADLAGRDYAGGVAVPDPAVAASALGALGWFAAAPGYGVGFYRTLRANGAVQVSTPDDVTTGVAQGRYRAGITIATSAYAAKDAGSPVEIAWPEPGAIAVYEPIALARRSGHPDAGKDFISFVVGEEGQRALAGGGSYPILATVRGPEVPVNAPVVQPDWAAIGADRASILAEYQRVFGG